MRWWIAGSGMVISAAVIAATVTAKPKFGAFGIDTSAADPRARAGDDFYRMVNGHWLATTQIPADVPFYGEALRLSELNRKRSLDLLEAAAQSPADGEERKLGDYYASFMDRDAIDHAGIAPVAPEIARIEVIGANRDLAAAIGALARDATPDAFGTPQSPLPIDFDISVDPKHPTRYLAEIDQGGLGLPDRSYYLGADPEMAKARAAYRAYLVAILTGVGLGDPAARADGVIALETKLAAADWDRADLRDVDKTYNPMTIAQLAAAAPGFDWAAYFAAVGIRPDATVIVGQPSALKGFAALAGSAPIAAWRDYLVGRRIADAAQVLPTPFVDADFAYQDKALNDIPEPRARWKWAVNYTNRAMGKAIGRRYAARYFSPEAKRALEAMIVEIRAAMAARINRLVWMAPETKRRAEAKLANLIVEVGYPDRWTDYSGLRIVRGDAYGNFRRANAFENRYRLALLDGPVDRHAWRSYVNPQTVNAFNTGSLNKLLFPAGYLQPPNYDPAADPAVNYGAIGAVIGHEISHSFDDQGAKLDEHGALSTWWTPADVAAFKAATARLAAQVGGYEPLPGLHINGQLTLGESTADLAGLLVALDAYHASLHRRAAPVLGGMTGDQRFFEAFAQIWREIQRDGDLRQQLATDQHPPSRFRAQTVRNVDDWYAAFDVKPTDSMALPPGRRVRIW